MAISFPLFCTINTIKDNSKEKLIKMQYQTFWYQTLATVLIYVPCLIGILYMINFTNWKYDSQVIFNNKEALLTILSTILMGIVSLILAWNPNIFNAIENFWTSLKKNNQEGNSQEPICVERRIKAKNARPISYNPKDGESIFNWKDLVYFFVGIVLLVTVFLPVIGPYAYMSMNRHQEAFLYQSEGNHTIAIKVN